MHQYNFDQGPPEPRDPNAPHENTRTLPRGCVAADALGDLVVVWPDGSYGYDKETKAPAGLASFSFGPYRVMCSDLSAEQCDAVASYASSCRLARSTSIAAAAKARTTELCPTCGQPT